MNENENLTIGKLIKDGLKSKNISLEELRDKCNIPKKYFYSIIEDKIENYPPYPYLKGYLKEIAKELNIDLALIKKILEKQNIKPPDNLQSKYSPILDVNHKRKIEKEKGHGFLIGFLIFILLVSVILYFAIHKTQQKQQPPPQTLVIKKKKKIAHIKPKINKKVTKKKKIAKILPSQPPKKPKISKKLDNLTLTICGKELTWIRVTIDNETVKTYFVKKNDNVTLHAKKFFKLDIGNCGGIDLIFNGRNLGSPGKRGEVKHIILDRSMMQ